MSAAGTGAWSARTRDRHTAVHGLLAAGHSSGKPPASWAWPAVPCTGSRPRPAPRSCWSRRPAGKPSSTAISRTCDRRWNEGITSAAALHAELQAKGWQGSVQAVQRYVRPFRAMTAAPPPGPVVPATRQITRWLLTRPAALGDEEQAQLAGIRTAAPTWASWPGTCAASPR